MNLLRHAVVFVVLATVLLAIVGCLARGGIISFNLDLDQAPLDAGTQRFVRAWLRLGLVLGVVTPLVVCLCWLRSSDVRQTLGVYVMVLVAQIATEVMMRRLFFTSMLVRHHVHGVSSVAIVADRAGPWHIGATQPERSAADDGVALLLGCLLDSQSDSGSLGD